MLLANNGKASSSKRSHHPNIQYYVGTDRIAARERKCPTGDMIAVFFAKPLHWSLFKTLCFFIMNWDLDPIREPDPRSVLKHKRIKDTGNESTCSPDCWIIIRQNNIYKIGGTGKAGNWMVRYTRTIWPSDINTFGKFIYWPIGSEKLLYLLQLAQNGEAAQIVVHLHKIEQVSKPIIGRPLCVSMSVCLYVCVCVCHRDNPIHISTRKLVLLPKSL
jgi:hypothetical protein